MKKWGMALCALGWFCLFAALLLTVLVSCGTNDGIYRELQEANGLPEAAGVTQEEMERLDGMLADYLSGDEAALDDSNVTRFAQYLHKLTKNTQFIVITHRRGTMTAADRLYGITMQEKGVSTLVSVDLIEGELDK